MSKQSKTKQVIQILPYQLIEFVQRGRPKQKKIDVVPADWIFYDKTRKKNRTKYPPPPYDEGTCELLHELVKKLEKPLPDWPEVTVAKFLGHAASCEVALARLKLLETVPFAFITDSEVDPATKSRQLEEQCRTMQLKRKAEVLKDKLIPPDGNVKGTNKKSGGNKSQPSTSSQQVKNTSKQKDPKSSKSKKRTSTSWEKFKRHYTGGSDDEDYDEYRLPSDKESQSDSGSEVDTNNSEAMQYTRGQKVFMEGSNAQIPGRFNISAPISIQAFGDDDDDYGSNSESGQSTPKRQKILEKTRSSEKSHTSNPILGQENILIKLTEISSELRKVRAENKEMSVKIIAIDSELKEARVEIMEMKGLLTNCTAVNNPMVATSSYAEKYEIVLPLNTYDEFDSFNEKLSNLDELRKDIANLMRCEVDRKLVLTKSITNVFKQIFSRNLALQYTAMKKMEGKRVLKDSALFKLLFEVLPERHKGFNDVAVSQHDILTAAGSALTNAKDWDGHRKTRNE